MITKVVKDHIYKHNTVILVENSLIVLGVFRVLDCYKLKIEMIEYENLLEKQYQNTILITKVSKESMPHKAKLLLSMDASTRIITICNKIEIYEIEKLVELGVRGILSNRMEEDELIQAIKQVLLGYIFIENRYLKLLIQDYRKLKIDSLQNAPINAINLKELLTNKEYEVINLVAEGYSCKQIADRLVISERSTRLQISKIIKKLEVKDKLNAVIKFLKIKWGKL
ncbi:response regulator transcription factor [Bacillus sp. JJ664]